MPQLTDQQVVDMRDRVRNGATVAAIADEIGVSRSIVSRAVRGVTYRHVGAAPAGRPRACVRALTPAIVRRIREMKYIEFRQLADIVAEVGIAYGAVKAAANWETYIEAGGPGNAEALRRYKNAKPARPRPRRRGPCRRCSVLTDDVDQLCQYCRAEGHI